MAKLETADTVDYQDYFTKFGLEEILDPSQHIKESKDTPCLPVLEDLHRLHRFIIDHKRTTVLEFGCGWSSLVFCHALKHNEELYKDTVKDLRRNNPFELHVLDDIQQYLDIAQSRIPENLKKNAFFYQSDVSMVTFNDRIATAYDKLPLINPDFIYLDGPSQFSVKGEISGFSTAHTDLMPMSCDILKIEHFLIPGTMIVVDGRAANARFLKANLQRQWDYQYDEPFDQHIFVLNESPLGKINEKQLEFYRS